MSGIETHYAPTFKKNVEILLQQRGSKLRGTFAEEPCEGDRASVREQFEAVEYIQSNTVAQPLTYGDTPGNRRWLSPTVIKRADLVSKLETLQSVVGDPTSYLATNAMYAIGRGIDDGFLRAFFGTAYTGREGTTAVTFDSSMEVGVDIGGTGSGLNVAKLMRAQRYLQDNDVDTDVEKVYCPVTPVQWEDLLKETQITSYDYNDDRSLKTGILGTFLGITFIKMTRLARAEFRVGAVANGNYQLPLYVPSAMTMGVWSDIDVMIREQPSLVDVAHPYSIVTTMAAGWTRTNEKKCAKIICAA